LIESGTIGALGGGSGVANEAIGRVKQGIGSVIGSERMQTEGAAQEINGYAQKAAGDATKKSVNKAADAGNKNLGLNQRGQAALREAASAACPQRSAALGSRRK
jgi:uncharacterized protein YjbJ (UPF0337 family)